jgi:hypothetical protein
VLARSRRIVLDLTENKPQRATRQPEKKCLIL